MVSFKQETCQITAPTIITSSARFESLFLFWLWQLQDILFSFCWHASTSEIRTVGCFDNFTFLSSFLIFLFNIFITCSLKLHMFCLTFFLPGLTCIFQYMRSAQKRLQLWSTLSSNQRGPYWQFCDTVQSAGRHYWGIYIYMCGLRHFTDQADRFSSNYTRSHDKIIASVKCVRSPTSRFDSMQHFTFLKVKISHT